MYAKSNSLLNLLDMILVVTSQLRQLFSLFVLQQDQTNLTDWILIEKLFNKQLQHLHRVEKSCRLEIGHWHCLGAVEQDVQVSHHAQSTWARLGLATFPLCFLYDIIDGALDETWKYNFMKSHKIISNCHNFHLLCPPWCPPTSSRIRSPIDIPLDRRRLPFLRNFSDFVLLFWFCSFAGVLRRLSGLHNFCSRRLVGTLRNFFVKVKTSKLHKNCENY